MCIKKVACGLKKVTREDGREVLEPIYVEVETPEDMHRVSGKIESCKTVTPKIVEEKVQEVGVLPSTVQNEHGGTHGGHGDANGNGSPITGNGSPTNSNGSPREVVCIETGEVFANATQAGKSTGIARQHINACCNGKRKSAGGKHWMYV